MPAVDMLVGLSLVDGWTVTSAIVRPSNASGGVFSQSYVAEKDGRRAFVKALDFSRAFDPGEDTLGVLQEFVAAYENERDVLEHCKAKRLSHVTVAIGHGSVDVPGMNKMEGRVYYLLFDMADGDVRVQMDASLSQDALWCMQALRSAALGLWQVHRELIAHQDMKPSNLLSFKGGAFKVADFGRASRRGKPIFYDDLTFPGDRTYAPPELLYGHVNPDFVPRRLGTDLYMLGNLAAFLFSGTNVTAEILAGVDPQHHRSRWTGTYDEVLPYLQESFSRFLERLEDAVPTEVQAIVVPMVRHLCDPDLAKRGHPRGVKTNNQYSLERYVSELSNLARSLELRGPRRSGAAA